MGLRSSDRIVVYGIGKTAANYISTHRWLNIVGVVDRNRMGGLFMGLPVFIIESVADKDIDAIVIASMDRHVRSIYERIAHFCSKNGILIYDRLGQNLVKYFGFNFAKQPMIRACSDLIRMIDESEIVCFDVFDTLVMRTVIEPTEVFNLVEESLMQKGIMLSNFRAFRREAEIKADGADIYAIYNILQADLGLSDDIRDIVLEEELKFEKECIIPRTQIVEVYRYALEKKKTVYLVSDMYIPSDRLAEILRINGIEGFSDLYISCEWGRSKGNGLFEIIRNRTGEKSALHIGDNYEADIAPAKKAGFKTYHIENASQILNYSEWSNSMQHINTLGDRLVFGLMISDAYNNPFHHFSNGISYLMLLPFALIYCKKIIELLIKNEYDGILFASRDEYFFYNVIGKLLQAMGIQIPLYYIYSSRKLSYKIGIKSEEDISTIAKYIGEVDFSIVQMLLYGDSEIGERDFVKRCIRTRSNYKEYLASKGVDYRGKYLLCELDGSGTSLHYLNRLFESDLDGVYLFRYHVEGKYDPPCYSVFDFDFPDHRYSNIITSIDLFEGIFSSPEPSVMDIDDNGLPVFDNEYRNREEIERMMDQQRKLESSVLSIYSTLETYGMKLSEDFAEHVLDVYCRLSDEITDERPVLYDELNGGVEWHM